MRFENAKHFLHIDSYARVTAIQYGEGRSNGQSGTPVPTVDLYARLQPYRMAGSVRTGRTHGSTQCIHFAKHVTNAICVGAPYHGMENRGSRDLH